MERGQAEPGAPQTAASAGTKERLPIGWRAGRLTPDAGQSLAVIACDGVSGVRVRTPG